jgi:hypothetical protein
MRTHVLLFALLLGTGAEAFASGHGPVFGFATPVNSQGEWSFDAGMFGRNATFGSQLTADDGELRLHAPPSVFIDRPRTRAARIVADDHDVGRRRVPNQFGVAFSSSAECDWKPLRKHDRPWDWRLFAEFSGEYVGLTERAGALMPGSDASQIFGGPTVLGIYKYFAISGGAQFPIYRDMGRLYPRERVRFAINVSYFLFSHSH